MLTIIRIKVFLVKIIIFVRLIIISIINIVFEELLFQDVFKAVCRGRFFYSSV